MEARNNNRRERNKSKKEFFREEVHVQQELARYYIKNSIIKELCWIVFFFLEYSVGALGSWGRSWLASKLACQHDKPKYTCTK